MRSRALVSTVMLFLAVFFGAFCEADIVATWLFDEGEGDTVSDSSGNGHEGKFFGDIKWTDGKYGDALDFTNGGHIEVPHADDLNLKAWTIMAWVKVETTGSYQTIVSKKDAEKNFDFVVRLDGGQVHHAFDGAGNFLNTNESVGDGEWHHIAVSYDMKIQRDYIDGEVKAERENDTEPPFTNAPVKIGVTVNGLIDEIQIRNNVVTLEELKRCMEGLAALQEAVPEGKLLFLWSAIRNQVLK